MSNGLFGKYRVEHADGSPTDANAQYFVLRVDTDANARHALRIYARSIFNDNRTLARDLIRGLNEIEHDLAHPKPEPADQQKEPSAQETK